MSFLRKNGKRKTRHTFWLGNDLGEWVRDIAFKRRISQSEFVRYCLENAKDFFESEDYNWAMKKAKEMGLSRTDFNLMCIKEFRRQQEKKKSSK